MPWANNRPPANTRGYGPEHQAERRRRLPLYTPDDACGWCHLPLGENRREWHLPHNRTRTGYLPGFWHGRCNRSEGAQAGRARQDTTSLRW